MAFIGKDAIDIGRTRIGQRYRLGADVPLNNPAWRGPWDCAGFASWCVYQAYGLVFGAGRPRRVELAEPYSGHWFDEASPPDVGIDPAKALLIPGAILIRKPRKKLIGHVAISLGDGRQTLEARSRADGVGIFDRADTRLWDRGALMPGVDYDLPGSLAFDGPPLKPAALPEGYLALGRPMLKSAAVLAAQRALLAADIDPGGLDGEFGPLTDAAVVCFQNEHGLEVDGIIGPRTAAALGLGFPIKPTAADRDLFDAQRKPAAPGKPPAPPAGAAADLVASIRLVSGSYTATTVGNVSFRFGKRVPYTDDMARVGLNQGGPSLADASSFGAYKASDFATELGQWAHFLVPTLTAEGGALYATLNTYDRAAFTFGAPQLAAHTPDLNFGPYLRRLLALPAPREHFPELSLRPDPRGVKTAHLALGDGSFRNLEEAVLVTRPNGRREKQAIHLMRYLNSDPEAVDDAETLAAARLINWLRQDRTVALLQIETFIAMAKLNFATAKTKMPAFDGSDWRIALWVMDILNQGRGTYAAMNAALGQPNPVDAISRIGEGSYGGRVRKVRDGVAALARSGVMTGFTV